MAKPKLALLALDVADGRLVRRLAAEGHLPTFARLFGSGLTVSITTPPAVLEGGIWPTLLTSSSPATHGVISFQGMKPGTYEVENPMYADRLPSVPFWMHMSRAGKRVAVVDVPFARPLDLNGVQVTNWEPTTHGAGVGPRPLLASSTRWWRASAITRFFSATPGTGPSQTTKFCEPA